MRWGAKALAVLAACAWQAHGSARDSPSPVAASTEVTTVEGPALLVACSNRRLLLRSADHQTLWWGSWAEGSGAPDVLFLGRCPLRGVEDGSAFILSIPRPCQPVHAGEPLPFDAVAGAALPDAVARSGLASEVCDDQMVFADELPLRQRMLPAGYSPLQRWLRRWGEPSLLAARGDAGRTAYRMVVLPSFTSPVSVRVEVEATGSARWFSVIDPSGRLTVKREAAKASGALSPDQLSRLRVALARADVFGNPPKPEDRYCLDGSTWLVEALEAGRYQVTILGCADDEDVVQELERVFRETGRIGEDAHPGRARRPTSPAP